MHVHGSEERLIQATRGDTIVDVEPESVLKRSKKERRLQDWEKKYGRYLRQTKEVRSDQYWAWIQNRDLKRETASLIVAAQN